MNILPASIAKNSPEDFDPRDVDGEYVSDFIADDFALIESIAPAIADIQDDSYSNSFAALMVFDKQESKLYRLEDIADRIDKYESRYQFVSYVISSSDVINDASAKAWEALRKLKDRKDEKIADEKRARREEINKKMAAMQKELEELED